MSILNNYKEEYKDSFQYKNIKRLLKEKKLNPKKTKDLKYLISLTLGKEINKINFDYLLTFLLEYITPKNEKILYEYFFQSCELGLLNNNRFK